MLECSGSRMCAERRSNALACYPRLASRRLRLVPHRPCDPHEGYRWRMIAPRSGASLWLGWTCTRKQPNHAPLRGRGVSSVSLFCSKFLRPDVPEGQLTTESPNPATVKVGILPSSCSPRAAETPLNMALRVGLHTQHSMGVGGQVPNLVLGYLSTKSRSPSTKSN
jgi:hypothetical protein